MTLALKATSVPELAGIGRPRQQTVPGRRGSVSRIRWAAGDREAVHVHPADEFLFVLSGQLDVLLLDGEGRRHRWCAGPGDFARLPAMAVHRVGSTGDEPAESVSFLGPPGELAEPGSETPNLLAAWESAPAGGGGAAVLRADPKAYPENAFAPIADGGLALFRRGATVESHRVDNPDGTTLETRMVFGPGASLMEGTRPPGYHSRPHVHACEQLNLVLAGHLWGYVVGPDGAGHGFELGPGDFWRVPDMAVHWIFNRSPETCRLIELHAPGLQDDAKLRDSAAALLAHYEKPSPRPVLVSNVYVDVRPDFVTEVEAQGSETA